MAQGELTSMSISTVSPATAPVSDHLDTGSRRHTLWHIPSEADPDKGLCGARLTAESRDVPNGDPDSCIVCEDLAAWGAR